RPRHRLVTLATSTPSHRSTGPHQTKTATVMLGLSLIVIATAQLRLVLDDTIANVASPSIGCEMAIPAAILPWIISAYILAFGGLLLFDDLLGRRRVFRAGLSLFTVASLLGGLGVNAEMLIGTCASPRSRGSVASTCNSPWDCPPGRRICMFTKAIIPASLMKGGTLKRSSSLMS
ncbi:hypothetical protein ACFQX4_25225, partial [Roseomonas sp. GCM10028921]